MENNRNHETSSGKDETVRYVLSADELQGIIRAGIAPGGVTAPKTATGTVRTIALIGTGRQARSRAGSPASPGRGSMSLT